MIAIEEAYRLIDQAVQPHAPETVPLDQVVGRVLVDNIRSDVDSPPHDKSVMDGFAVRSSDVTSMNSRLEVVGTIVAGDWPSVSLAKGQAAKIMTGAPLPNGADAVVMVEMTREEESEGKLWVVVELDSLQPEKHVLRKGVNFGKGQIVLPAGHRLRPTDVGLLAEVGAHRVSVGGAVRVAVLPTGSELVSCEQLPDRGQIRNSNGPMLVAMARSLGMKVSDLGVGVDDPDQLRALISQGLKHDVLLLSGGVSAGTKDLVPGILNELGVRQVFHKVCVKPGKPIWFGILEHESGSTYVFGLPGNPVSSLVGFQLFVRAALRKLTGGKLDGFQSEIGELNKPHQTRGNRPTYWPAKRVVDDTPVRKFQPLVWRGSSDLFALGESDGLIYFPADSNDHPAGETVRFFPMG